MTSNEHEICRWTPAAVSSPRPKRQTVSVKLFEQSLKDRIPQTLSAQLPAEGGQIDKLDHGDLGQMQMYVNYFYRHVKQEDELPTNGIVLCARKNDALVELTLPENANIFASKYQLYLPGIKELKQELENIKAELDEQMPEDPA